MYFQLVRNTVDITKLFSVFQDMFDDLYEKLNYVMQIISPAGAVLVLGFVEIPGQNWIPV